MTTAISAEERVKRIHNNFMLLMRVSKRWLGQRLQSYGLTLPQFVSLTSMAAYQQPCTMSDITNATFQDPPTTTGVVDRLVKMKFAERTRSKTDRRVVLVQATPAGIEIINQIETNLLKEITPSYALLSTEELDTLEHLLRRLWQIHFQRYMSVGDSDVDAEIEKVEQFATNPIAYSKLENRKIT